MSRTDLTSTAPPDDGHRFLGLTSAQIAGGALAAVTAALAASFFGVGGTLIGAALGSVISTVGGALYSHSFDRAHETIRTTRVRLVRSPAAAATPLSGPHAGMDDPVNLPPDLDDRAQVVAEAPGTLDTSPQAQPSDSPAVARPGRRLNVRLMAVVAGVFFVIAVGAITLTELVLGHPVSDTAQTGTSITQVVGGGAGRSDVAPTPSPDASTGPSVSPTAGPDASPSDTAPSDGASPAASDPGAAPSDVAPSDVAPSDVAPTDSAPNPAATDAPSVAAAAASPSAP
jgi:hypothetical protein